MISSATCESDFARHITGCAGFARRAIVSVSAQKVYMHGDLQRT